MNRPRHLASWRLVATVAVVSVLAAGVAFAQTMKVRVKVGPASIYDKARTSSEVVLTVPEGTILDALGKTGTWYWVLLPPDANGVRRGGYIPAYVVEPVSAKGKPQPETAAPPEPRPAKPPAKEVEKVPRYFFGIGGGGQTSSPDFTDNVSFPLYDETCEFQAVYSTAGSSGLDVTAALRLSPKFVIAVAYWHATSTTSASVTAMVPHPFVYDSPRAWSAQGLDVTRSENDGHLQITYLAKLARTIDLALFAGPSLFYLRQDFITALQFDEKYPFETPLLSGFTTGHESKFGFGANAGADLTVMVWRYLGVGVGGRYARGLVKMTGVNGGPVNVKVGGAQVSGGLRLRF